MALRGDQWRSKQTTRTSDIGWDMASPTAMTVKRRVFQLLRMPYDRLLDEGIQVPPPSRAGCHRSHMAVRPSYHGVSTTSP